ncbi:MAG: Ig-like domain-containing protein, partial [Acidimicrobiia bacterium]|nr:Ig-like domain-containing protein [Acidimicrobiia bacterium]
AGTYTITLTVTDNQGVTDTDTAGVTIAPNAKPVVSVTAPAGTGLITGPLTVRIQATDVESADGTLTVEYRIDGTAFRSASYNTVTKRYESTIDTKTLTDGSHSVTARATDGFGNTTTSSAVTFVVDNNEPPTARITSPLTNTTVSGSITIKAAATDDKAVDRVEFSLDGVRIGTDSSSAGGWSFVWDTTKATSGPHTITATAIDGFGKKGSGGVFVTVDQPPTVAITSPRAGAVVRERVTITTNAKDDVKIEFVEFFVDGVRLGADTNPSAGWSFSWNTREVDNGRHTILALASDSNDETVTTSIQVTVDNDLAPRVTITSPRDGATIYGVGIVQITATATDEEGVRQVEFFVDGTSIGVDDVGSNGWSTVWNPVRATIGSHIIRAVGTDSIGQTAADSNKVIVQAFTAPTTTPPASTTTVTTVAVDTPAEGLSATAFSLAPPTVSAGGEIALTVALAAEIPGKANVQFLLDGEALGDVATVNAVQATFASGSAAVFTRTLPAGIEVGLHRIEAVTTDEPPQVLASRTVGVVADETNGSGAATPPGAGGDGTTKSPPPIGLILAVVIGSVAAMAAAGFGAAGWYRRKMVVRRLAARGR